MPLRPGPCPAETPDRSRQGAAGGLGPAVAWMAPLYTYSDSDYDTDSDKVLMRIQRISSNSMQQSHIAAMEDAAR